MRLSSVLAGPVTKHVASQSMTPSIAEISKSKRILRQETRVEV